MLAFVAWRAVKLWREGSPGEVELRPGWLALAGLFYAVGWLPSVWFWRVALARLGDEISWPAAARAYYVGHLGKYVPGKALVPVIRGQMAAAAGGRFGAGVLAVVFETVVMMGVGGEVAAMLVAYLLPADLERSPALLRGIVMQPAVRHLIEVPFAIPLIVLALVLISLPIVARLFSWAARKFTPVKDDAALANRFDAKLIGVGFVAFAAAWTLHGLSLWATLRGIGVSAPLANLPGWTAIVALSTFAGFLAVFAPGGAGVREGFLIELLKVQPAVDPRQAVAAALLLRAVWLATEVVVAGALYYGLKPRTIVRSDQGADATRPA